MKKFLSTIRICYRLAMARTFGEYEHTTYEDGWCFAVYHRNGEVWKFPTKPFDKS